MDISAEKIRVLRIINRFNLGGITYNVSYLSRYMPERYETLLVGGPEEKGEGSSLFIPQSLGLSPVVLPEMQRSVNPLSDLRAIRRIRKIIKDYKPHIVHTHASKAGLVGRLAALSCNVPVIVHTFHGHVFHGYFNSVVTTGVKAIEWYLASRTDAIVAISETQRKEICNIHRICSTDKTTVIPLGFDLERFITDKESKRRHFREKYSVGEDEIAIGLIGRLAPVKNHAMFIDSLAEVIRQTKRKIRGFIIGDGDIRKDLENLAKTRGLTSQNLQFTGWITEADVALAGLDLVALTSRNEGTPVSLIEAQASGRFIVSTEVGGIRDILEDRCGLLSAPEDKEAFTRNLADAVENFETYTLNAGAASAKVLRKFSYTRLCSDMDSLYTKLLGR